ncbi:MAG: energy-coupling factor transporter transmembrane protein EcfT [Oscillospiraceae bacterium]|nr:energy-coupling factor transporter transmembrane protein EcfT [Oscillospiraceae bacterium]
MHSDGFSKYHPLTNFLFFLGAILFGVLFQHPAYLLAGMLCAGIYYVLLQGRKALKAIAGMLLLLLIVALINPIFNTQGSHILFRLFGRPYTLEALVYGFAVGSILVITLLWFGCYNQIMTEDKFTVLFGNLAPSLSLLLVMVFRLIPNLLSRARQINDARRAIGKGGDDLPLKEKITQGMAVLTALTGWALEGSIVTADSMRSRGYGAAKRTCFQIYQMGFGDYLVILAAVLAAIVTIIGAVTGATDATYTPLLWSAPVSFFLPVYCIYLLIPTFIHVKEVLQCRIFISRI